MCSFDFCVLIFDFSSLPNTKSAKKALRQNKKNNQHNIWLKDRYKKTKKEIEKFLEAKKIKEATALLPSFYKYVDKATKNGVIKKNTAARKKATMVRQLLKI